MAILVFVTSGLHAQDTLDHKRHHRWYVPDFATLQYAGSIGLFAGGAGYTIFRDRANIDVLVGFVPGSIGNAPLETITLKFTTAPWQVKFKHDIIWRPFSAGVYFCYTPGREYSSDLPSWYPSGYYWWSEAVRANIFIGGNGSILTHRTKPFSRFDLYYEVGTNEIKLVSYFQNRDYLSWGKILHVGIGVRAHFRK